MKQVQLNPEKRGGSHVTAGKVSAHVSNIKWSKKRLVVKQNSFVIIVFSAAMTNETVRACEAGPMTL